MELHEAAFYGLAERIPALLTSVHVDAADSVSMRSTVELYFLSPSSKGNSDLYVTTVIITAKKEVKAMIVLHTPCHSGVGRCLDKGGLH